MLKERKQVAEGLFPLCSRRVLLLLDSNTLSWQNDRWQGAGVCTSKFKLKAADSHLHLNDVSTALFARCLPLPSLSLAF
jgi:hypothetical protein